MLSFRGGDLSNFDSLNFPYSSTMKSCIQDSVYHAEGDVWTHINMVADQIKLRNGLDQAQLLTTLYHDVHKPLTRTEEIVDGRIKVSHPNHSRLGAQEAWFDMWQQGGIDLKTRLEVYWRCKWHQRVFHMWTQPDMLRSALTYAVVGNWNELIEFAHCDNLGRICPNPQEATDALDLLTEWLDENNVVNLRMNEYSWRTYFEKLDRSPLYVDRSPTGSHVVILSGLPGSGKNTYCQKWWADQPIINLDEIRKIMGVKWNDNQGKVIQLAKEQARIFLRDKISFVWNATNITFNMRQQLISLFRQYDAYVSIKAFDVDKIKLLKQNKNRENMVPEDIIIKLAKKWEPPSLLEAHSVEWV